MLTNISLALSWLAVTNTVLLGETIKRQSPWPIKVSTYQHVATSNLIGSFQWDWATHTVKLKEVQFRVWTTTTNQFVAQ